MYIFYTVLNTSVQLFAKKYKEMRIYIKIWSKSNNGESSLQNKSESTFNQLTNQTRQKRLYINEQQ